MHGINGAQAEEIANALNADEIYDNVGYLQIRFYDLDVEKINKNINILSSNMNEWNLQKFSLLVYWDN